MTQNEPDNGTESYSEWERELVSTLKENGIELIAYLPGTAIDGIIKLAERDDFFTSIRVTREEQAIGIVSGAWLVHTRGALVCQSSGLANSLNALTSLNKVARIPFLGIVVRRGDLGEFNAAQVPFGYNMPDVLDQLGIRNHQLGTADDIRERIDMATKSAFSTEEPYVVTLESTVTGAKDEF